MQISRWGNSLAVRIPQKVARDMKLKEGDQISLKQTAPGELEIDRVDDERLSRAEEMHDKIRLKLPPGWKFDREEIYEDRMRELGW
jgi:antitoxin MazE